MGLFAIEFSGRIDCIDSEQAKAPWESNSVYVDARGWTTGHAFTIGKRVSKGNIIIEIKGT